ncbi:MAG TPA: nuclear transport factor 2 family protein [Terriglobales bacterium]|nr:nuclear transport factor 2 family protein [Terriglobales bacterium]
MMKPLIVLAAVVLAWMPLYGQNRGPEAEVRRVIEQFEQGLAERNVAQLEPLVASDLVVLENGGRNDGWVDFRDHHLIPEFQEPAPPSKAQVVKIVASPQMGWGYTRTDMTLTRKSGQKVEAVLWSVYVVEKRAEGWKLVLLDWSFKVQPPPASK